MRSALSCGDAPTGNPQQKLSASPKQAFPHPADFFLRVVTISPEEFLTSKRTFWQSSQGKVEHINPSWQQLPVTWYFMLPTESSIMHPRLQK